MQNATVFYIVHVTFAEALQTFTLFEDFDDNLQLVNP